MMNRRWLFAGMALCCAALTGFGLFLQYQRGLEPCPLCMVQRVAFYAVLAVSLLGLLHGAGRLGTRVYASLALLFAAFGAGIAGRQIWLQHLPADQVPECGPGLDFMLEVYPMRDLIVTLLSGTGECAEVVWRFLGLSIPEWSLLWFLAFAATALVLVLRPEPPAPAGTQRV